MKKEDQVRCSCLKSIHLPNCCVFAELWLKTHYKIPQDTERISKKYERFVNLGLSSDLCSLEISKDLKRTFPYKAYFQDQEEEGTQKLERVLRALVAYDKEVGYVSGMNFLAGVFLLHCEEHIAFSNITILFKKLNARQILIPGYPGLAAHKEIIEVLVMSHYPGLYKELVRDSYDLGEKNVFLVLFELFK